MGSGKGSPEYWVAVVKPGRVMFEIAGVSEETAREALRLASHKLPPQDQDRHQGRDREQVVNKMKANEIRTCPDELKPSWPISRRTCSSSVCSMPPTSLTTP